MASLTARQKTMIAHLRTTANGAWEHAMALHIKLAQLEELHNQERTLQERCADEELNAILGPLLPGER